MAIGTPPSAFGNYDQGVIPGASQGGGGNPNWQSWNSNNGNVSDTYKNFSAPPSPGGALPPPDFGGSSGAPMGAFDDGGEVGDSGGGNSSQAPSLDDAMNTIQNTLAYGRQQSGLTGGDQGGDQGGGDQPQPGGFANNWQNMRPSTNVDDQQDTSAVGSSDVPQGKDNSATSPLGSTQKQTPGTYPYGPQVGLGRSAAGAGPVMQGLADGGDVSNPSAAAPAQPQGAPQGQPQGAPQGGVPPKLMRYATGADAVQPEVAAAIERKVDPQGQMDPTARRMLAIAAAPDQQTQWGMLQHYRQKFNAYSAFAQAALKGSPQKPPDPVAAAKALTQAYENVPDGKSVSFEPTQGGAVAHVKPLTSGKSQAAPQQDDDQAQGFADGGGVLPDPGTDTEGVPSYDASQDQQSTTPGQGKSASEGGGTAKGDQGPQGTDTPLSNDQLGQVAQQAHFESAMNSPIEDIINKIAKVKGRDDNSEAQLASTQSVADPDAVRTAAGYGTADYDPTKDKTVDPDEPEDVNVLPSHATKDQTREFNKKNRLANHGHPEGAYGQFAPDENGDISGVRTVGYGVNRQQGTPEQRAQKNAIELQQEKNKGLLGLGGIRADAQKSVAQTRADTSTQNNQRTVGQRMAAAIMAATGRSMDSGLAALTKRADALTAAGVTDPKQIQQALAPFSGQAGVNYQMLQQVIQHVTQGQQQPQQPQPQPAAGGAPPAQDQAAQDQAALSWAKANPTDPRAAQIKQRLGM